MAHLQRRLERNGNINCEPGENLFVLNWIGRHIGSGELRHGIVLVAGISVWPTGIGPDQLAEFTDQLAASLKNAVEDNGGVIQYQSQSQVVAFWNCKNRLHDPSALCRAMVAAQQIINQPIGPVRPCAVLDAGRIHVSWQPDGQPAHMTSIAAETAVQCFALARPGDISISPTVDMILASFAPGTRPAAPKFAGHRMQTSAPIRPTHRPIPETVDMLASDPICSRLMPSTRAQIAHASGGLADLARDIGGLIASGTVPTDATRQDDGKTTAISVLLSCRLDAHGAFKPFVRAVSLFLDEIDIEVLASALDLDAMSLVPLFAWAVENAILEPITNTIGRPRANRLPFARCHRFTSPLIRDAAYRSIPTRKLRQLHARIAAAMQDSHNTGAAIDPAAIAEQFARAGRDDDAIRWWCYAAETAIAASASQTAIAHLQTALSHFEAAASPVGSGVDIGDLTRLYGPQLSAVKGNASPEVLSVYEKHTGGRDPAASTDLSHRFDNLWGVQTCYLVRGELDKACQNGAQLMACAFASGSDVHRILATRVHALLEFLLGNLDHARDHYLDVLSLHDPNRHSDLRHTYASDQAALAHAHLAWTYALLDDAPSARAAGQRALARAEHLDHPHTLAHTVCVLAAAHLAGRQPESSIPLAMAGRAIAQRHDFLYWGAWSQLVFAIAELQRPNAATANELISAIANYRATGARQILPLAYAALAQHHLERRDMKAARFALRRGLGESSETGIAAFSRILDRLAGQPGIGFKESNLSRVEP